MATTGDIFIAYTLLGDLQRRLNNSAFDLEQGFRRTRHDMAQRVTNAHEDLDKRWDERRLSLVEALRDLSSSLAQINESFIDADEQLRLAIGDEVAPK